MRPEKVSKQDDVQQKQTLTATLQRLRGVQLVEHDRPAAVLRLERRAAAPVPGAKRCGG